MRAITKKPSSGRNGLSAPWPAASTNCRRCTGWPENADCSNGRQNGFPATKGPPRSASATRPASNYSSTFSANWRTACIRRAPRVRNHDREGFDLQLELLKHLEKIWRQPDNGIWEIRGEKQHYTHSKMMAWVAFDRTIKSSEEFKLGGPVGHWKRVRQRIHRDVCRRGFNKKVGAFVQTYGSERLDASLLMMPLVGFLPATDPRVQSTVRQIEKHLMREGLVLRYRVPRTKAGSAGEGAFLPCSFWLADNYERMGRHKDAEELLDRLLGLCNDVGLLSEEYDFEKQRQLGNFPQAFTHLALINTILNLYAKAGGPAHRRSDKHLGETSRELKRQVAALRAS